MVNVGSDSPDGYYRLYRQPHASVGNRLSGLSFIEVVAAVVSVLVIVYLLR
jgi:hypothetical protein